MVSWSYELLPPATRPVFDRLGVFSSSLTLEAAEAVCQDDELAHDDAVAHEEVLDHVTTLVDHSLLAREPGPAPTSRYRLLETLRIFALARLTDAGHLVAARRAHADYFRRLATTAGAASYGPDELLWRGRMEAEEPNLQAALAWTAANEPRAGACGWPSRCGRTGTCGGVSAKRSPTWSACCPPRSWPAPIDCGPGA